MLNSIFGGRRLPDGVVGIDLSWGSDANNDGPLFDEWKTLKAYNTSSTATEWGSNPIVHVHPCFQQTGMGRRG